MDRTTKAFWWLVAALLGASLFFAVAVQTRYDDPVREATAESDLPEQLNRASAD